jgi:hypothetical protein
MRRCGFIPLLSGLTLSRACRSVPGRAEKSRMRSEADGGGRDGALDSPGDVTRTWE